MTLPRDADDQLLRALRKIWPTISDEEKSSRAVRQQEDHLERIHEMMSRIGECTQHTTENW